MRKKSIFTIISGILAVMFTVYIALDTFVISHAYTTSIENTANYNQNTDGKNGAETGTSGILSSVSMDNAENDGGAYTCNAAVTDTSYSDDNIKISISSYRENNTDIHVADVTISSPEYLKTALAKSTYGKNIVDTTSNIAEGNNAILAINGDYYGVQEKGYVIRSGVIYRDTMRTNQEDLAIYQDGSFEIINEQDVTADELINRGVYNLLSFGPGLIQNGEITVSQSDEVDKAMTSNPRTAIGVVDDLHYVFVVADGRTNTSAGLSLYELAQFMQSLGVKTAYNLDGGGSSTMYFNGEIINNPTSGIGKGHGKSGSTSSGNSERSVSDIVYIGY